MKVTRTIKQTLMVLSVVLPLQGHAVTTNATVTGKITNITSTSGSILVRIAADELPGRCTANTSWMEIPQDQTAMVSLTLAAWKLDKEVTVYAAPALPIVMPGGETTPSSEYCQVSQVHPVTL